MAVCAIVEVDPFLCSCAVTTTSDKAKLNGRSLKTKGFLLEESALILPVSF